MKPQTRILTGRRIRIHQKGTFIESHGRSLFAKEREFMAFILVDFLTPGGIDGLDVSQVIFLPDQVVPVVGSILDDYDPLEIDPEILDPLLDSFFDARVEAFQPNFKATAILVRTFELFLRWLDGALGHIEAVHEFPDL